jgi:hypothetical protein
MASGAIEPNGFRRDHGRWALVRLCRVELSELPDLDYVENEALSDLGTQGFLAGNRLLRAHCLPGKIAVFTGVASAYDHRLMETQNQFGKAIRSGSNDDVCTCGHLRADHSRNLTPFCMSIHCICLSFRLAPKPESPKPVDPR